MVRHHDPDVADGNQGLRTDLDRREPSVDEERAVGQHLQLLAPPASEREKRLRGLKVVVVAAGSFDFRRDDFSGFDGRAVMDGHDTDRVAGHHREVRPSDRGLRGFGDKLSAVSHDDGIEAVDTLQLLLPVVVLPLVPLLDRPTEDLVFGDHDEERQVDRIDALPEDGALPSSLSLGAQKRLCVLEMVAVDDAAQRLSRRQRHTVAGVDVADLALRDRDERLRVDPVLPWVEAEVNSSTQQLCLKSRLSMQRDDLSSGQRAGRRPELLDDTDLAVRDIADSRDPGNQ